MKKQIVALLLLATCLGNAMENSVFTQLIKLVKTGDATEVKAFLSQSNVGWEIAEGNDNNGVAELSKVLKENNYPTKHPTLYEEFYSLFLHRNYNPRREVEAWQEQAIDLLYENDKRQERRKIEGDAYWDKDQIIIELKTAFEAADSRAAQACEAREVTKN